MGAKIIDGKAVAMEIRQGLKKFVKECADRNLRPPGLAVILVGDDPASQVYVRNKTQVCIEVGIRPVSYMMPLSTSQPELEAIVQRCNDDEGVDGILVQFPLPEQLSESAIIEKIDPSKDVDGFHPYNVGRLTQRVPTFCACTPHGVMTLLRHIKYDVKGKNCLVIGASNIVGRPMALELLLAGASVSVTHKFTPQKELHKYIAMADVLIVAVGKPQFLDGSLIKKGAVVIDIGITRLPNGKLSGDVQFDKACERASYITPVPGGVGPMTVATLMENTVTAYKNHLGIADPGPGKDKEEPKSKKDKKKK